MSQAAHPQVKASDPVIGRLAAVAADRGAGELGHRLLELQRFIHDDVAEVQRAIDEIPRGERMIEAAAHHLLDVRGKHVRPMCVALASRCGSGFSAAARQLAVAVELVHTATLLHDDVIDEAVTRRGKPAARITYGNAASIFAGDWLLIAALQRVRAAGDIALLDRMLAIIDEMIVAESLQLERRGRIDGGVAEYLAIIEGKTAALFRWAMIAGGRIGGLGEEQQAALERYGFHLGVAFQAVDDALDYAGDVAVTGKDPGADLREGKLTYPLIVAVEREPRLRELLLSLLASGDGEHGARSRVPGIAAAVDMVRKTEAIEATRAFARGHIDRAIAALEVIPACPARDQLFTVASASLGRTA